MIYFITNHEDTYNHFKDKHYYNISVLKGNKDTLNFFKTWTLDKHEKGELHLGVDVETNGLDAHKNTRLLDMIGDKQDQFVLHSPYVDAYPYYRFIRNAFTIIGHNIKFDFKFIGVELDVWFKTAFDTMIADQRLYMKLGLRASLEAVMLRYLNVYPDTADKSIRNEFIDCNVSKFELKPRHIYYAAGDVEHLFPIWEKQVEYIKRYDMEFLLYGIEFPLIRIIAKAEVEGWDFNKEEWIAICKENIEARHELEIKLDEEVRRLRDLLLTNPKERLYMLGGKWDNIRKYNPVYDVFNRDGTTNVPDLFGGFMSKKELTGVKKKVEKNPNNINYESDSQIVEIFAFLRQPVLTKEEALVVPKIKTNGKVIKGGVSYTTSENAFTTYRNLLPESVMIPFIDMLLEHRGLSNAINNFGENFISKINPITGKLHTVFRQASAVTGRMQSGGGKLEPDKYNAQNIPSRTKSAIRMRNCFIAPAGYSIGTHDYSGAELIIMCSLSQDMRLLEMSKGDMHSKVAQACWRNIYKYRAHQGITEHETLRQNLGNNYTNKELVETINNYIKLSKTYIVDSKTGGGKVRVEFKPMTFGAIYGMYAGKAAKTLKVAKEEGQLILDTIRMMFPRVFAMVEAASSKARNTGYLILNTRTNSRAWFPTIIQVLKMQLNERDNYKLISKEVNEARNIKIQGTQADAIKEASVELQKYIDENDLDVTILKWVHDEIVDKHPKFMDGKSHEWKEWVQNPNNRFIYTLDDGTINSYESFPEVKAAIMENVFNRYLENVTIKVDYSVEDFWTK